MNTHSETHKSPAEKVAEIIKANDKKIVLFLGGVLLVLAGLAVFGAFSERNRDKALLAAEDVDELYHQWNGAAEADKAGVSSELKELIASSIEEFGGTYAALKALYVKGLLAAEEENWDESIAAFLTVAEEYPDSFYAPVSLFNAASVADQSGDSEQALAVYLEIASDFSDRSVDMPEVLFNIGRLYEQQGQGEDALEYYQKILDDYGTSSWKDIAKSCIISIKTNG